MKTICYMTGNQWQKRTTGSALPSREDKVIDLEAWKAENLILPEEPEAGQMSAPERRGNRERTRRRRATAWDWAELTATLAVTAVLVALFLRVLLF